MNSTTPSLLQRTEGNIGEAGANVNKGMPHQNVRVTFNTKNDSQNLPKVGRGWDFRNRDR